LVPNRPRILCESVANRWKIGQENSLGQTSVRLPGRYRAWLLGQRGAIAALIICELPGNYARIYFLAEGFNGVHSQRFASQNRTVISFPHCFNP